MITRKWNVFCATFVVATMIQQSKSEINFGQKYAKKRGELRSIKKETLLP